VFEADPEIIVPGDEREARRGPEAGLTLVTGYDYLRIGLKHMD